VPAKEEAKALVDQFAARNGPGVWTYLHRNVVAAELKARIDDPTKINQGQVGYCGPAAFLQDLATDDPALYAKMAGDLFDLGFAHAPRGVGGLPVGRFIVPDKWLRTFPIPFNKNGEQTYLPEADWLMLSSIRNASNEWWLDSVLLWTNKGAAGGTRADDLVDMFKAVGYSSVVNQVGRAAANSQFHALQASTLVDAGWRVVLFIDAALLAAMPAGTPSGLNHAVGLLTRLDGFPNALKGAVFTWGQTMRLPVTPSWPGGPTLDAAGNMTWATFAQYFYGYVAARY
jgi:hypothetical protein